MSDPRERVLAALGQALASVGHELNNVVGVLQSYASFIRETSSEPAVVADAQVIRSTTERARAAVTAGQLAFTGRFAHGARLRENRRNLAARAG